MGVTDRLIVALDYPSLDEALRMVDTLGDLVRWYKVGLELFSAEGPRVLEALRKRGARLFLDLKLHDIPETVQRAARSAALTEVDLITVHSEGGSRMMQRAVAGARSGGGLTRVLAVTVLTSLDASDLAEVGTALPLEQLVALRARLARAAGCDGVVASPREAAAIRAAVGSDFLIVTPGVRPEGAATDDQRRVSTAREARAAGADAVVVGRPIRDAADPRAAATALLAELA